MNADKSVEIDYQQASRLRELLEGNLEAAYQSKRTMKQGAQIAKMFTITRNGRKELVLP